MSLPSIPDRRLSPAPRCLPQLAQDHAVATPRHAQDHDAASPPTPVGATIEIHNGYS
jgi:hypothetical protein